MDLGELAELEAMHDLFTVAPAELAACTLESSGGAVAFQVRSLPPARELDRILGLSDVDELEWLEAFYEGRPFWVSLAPAANLDSDLVERGYSRDYAWQKFERDTAPLPARTELAIGAPREPGDFGRAFAVGYGLPPAVGAWADRIVGRERWACFVAYDGNEPVASGALFGAADCGWLGFAATVASHRGRGAQSGILAARIDRARELGLERLITETGVPRERGPGSSFRNLVRAGFRATYMRPNYASPRSAAGYPRRLGRSLQTERGRSRRS
jgi:GNAT superfamily N-acetyltransferase